MEHTQWRRPVQAAGLDITGPLEAIQFMDHRWPGVKAMSFATAHQSCLAALDGREKTDHARDCFKQAVDEAQLH